MVQECESQSIAYSMYSHIVSCEIYLDLGYWSSRAYFYSFQDEEIHGAKSFFTEITTSISDIKFTAEGQHILSRDYLNLKVWLVFWIYFFSW